jgi:O-antigen/teichoic acid export membrane protein
VITGVVFTLLLTRNMSQQQYGIWSNIFDLTGYFTILVGLFPFWATRFVARKKEGVIKMAVIANSVIALVAATVYLSVISTVTGALHINSAYLIVYMVASLQIVNLYLITILESCLKSMRPQAIGYGLLLEELCKVVVAYVLIVWFNQLFLGAMGGLIVGASIQALFYLWLLAGNLRERIRWNYLKEWIKGSTVIFYNSVGNLLTAFVFILLFIYGGEAARGEYQAAATFTTVIGYSQSLAYALYPKMLANACSDDTASLSFKTVLMFAIPMGAITIAMAKSFLTVLNISYSAASPVLMLLTLDTLVVIVSTFYSSYLLGMERLDEAGEIPFRKLVRSKIFMIFTIPYIYAALSLPSVYYVLTQLAPGGSVLAVMYVVAINMFVHLATFIGLYAFTRKSCKLKVAWKSIGKYLSASVFTAVLLYLLPSPTTIILTFGKVAVGGITYLALLLLIDAEARALVPQIWREIRGFFERFGKK